MLLTAPLTSSVTNKICKKTFAAIKYVSTKADKLSKDYRLFYIRRKVKL